VVVVVCAFVVAAAFVVVAAIHLHSVDNNFMNFVLGERPTTTTKATTTATTIFDLFVKERNLKRHFHGIFEHFLYTRYLNSFITLWQL